MRPVNRFSIQIVLESGLIYRTSSLPAADLKAKGEIVTLDAVERACQGVIDLIRRDRDKAKEKR